MSSSGRRAREDLTSVRDLLVETWHDTYDAIYGVERVTEITNEWHALERLARELERRGSRLPRGRGR